MSDSGVSQFIAMVSLHFPRPKFGGDEVMEDGWMSSMTLALSKFDDDVLRDSAQHILTNRLPKKDGAFFPAPAECIAVCNTVANQHFRESQKGMLLPGPSGDDWSDDRIGLAFDLMKGQLGRRAVAEGWLQGLYTFCRKQMRLPRTDAEIALCIGNGKIVEGVISKFRNDDPLHGAITRWGETLLQKRDELARKLTGAA